MKGAYTAALQEDSLYSFIWEECVVKVKHDGVLLIDFGSFTS